MLHTHSPHLWNSSEIPDTSQSSIRRILYYISLTFASRLFSPQPENEYDVDASLYDFLYFIIETSQQKRANFPDKLSQMNNRSRSLNQRVYKRPHSGRMARCQYGIPYLLHRAILSLSWWTVSVPGSFSPTHPWSTQVRRSRSPPNAAGLFLFCVERDQFGLYCRHFCQRLVVTWYHESKHCALKGK